MHRYSAEKKLVAPLLALGLGLGATACNNWNPKQNEQCIAVTQDGVQVKPKAFPLGEVAVIYEVPHYIEYRSARGLISEENGQQRASTHDLPKFKNTAVVEGFKDSKHGWDREDIAVAIHTPETGFLGFTTGCITTGLDTNNIPTTYISLPTSE